MSTSSSSTVVLSVTTNRIQATPTRFNSLSREDRTSPAPPPSATSTTIKRQAVTTAMARMTAKMMMKTTLNLQPSVKTTVRKTRAIAKKAPSLTKTRRKRPSTTISTMDKVGLSTLRIVGTIMAMSALRNEHLSTRALLTTATRHTPLRLSSNTNTTITSRTATVTTMR